MVSLSGILIDFISCDPRHELERVLANIWVAIVFGEKYGIVKVYNHGQTRSIRALLRLEDEGQIRIAYAGQNIQLAEESIKGLRTSSDLVADMITGQRTRGY